MKFSRNIDRSILQTLEDEEAAQEEMVGPWVADKKVDDDKEEYPDEPSPSAVDDRYNGPMGIFEGYGEFDGDRPNRPDLGFDLMSDELEEEFGDEQEFQEFLGRLSCDN